MKISLLLSLAVFCIALTVSAPTEARSKLSKAEVQRVFIGKWWRNPSGSFLFSRNGTYKYRRRGVTYGPWNYQFRPDGSIRGKTTDYQFYRKSNGGYEYFHSRTRQYIPAFVR